MGFMDKAKKMAEQAQTKLDEAQKQFNERQGPGGGPERGGGPAGGGGPTVEYDQHGRPIGSSPPPEGVTPPHGDPTPPHDPVAPMGAAAPPPPAPPSPPAAPASGDASGVEEDRNHPSYAPPKLSSGDPLAP